MALDLGELVAYLKLDDSGWDAALDKMPEKLKGKSGMMLGAAAVVGAAVGAALIAGVNDAMSFEATNDKVAAGLALTETESARVGALAGQVYADAYGESVEQVQSTVAGVITSIKGMGAASDEEVARMTANVLSYASAYEVDAASAISTVNQLVQAGFAQDGPAALDLMTAAMQRVPEALRGDLTDAINEYTPFLADLGLSGEEAFDLLAKGAEKGMYGIDKTGDALKEFGIRATDMSATSKTAYDALGMSQEDMTNRLLAGGETAKGAFDEIVAGLMAMEDPAARSQAALALFGTPLEDLSVSDIPQFLSGLQSAGDGMGDVAGKSDELAATMGGNAASAMESFTRQTQLVFAAVGEQLLPILTSFFGFMAENPALIQIMVAVLGVLALAFIGVSVATWAMNTALLANPITWIVIGIMALIAALILLIANWDTVVAWISEVWGGFVGWLTEVMDGLAAWWGEVWDGFISWLEEVWNGIVEFLLGVLDFIVQLFLNWTLLGIIIQYWDEIVAFIVAVWSGFVSWLTGIVEGVAAWWNAIWNAVGTTISNIWTGFVAVVRAIWQGWIAWIQGVVSGFVSFWSGVWSGVGSFINGIWSGIVSFATNAWNNLVSFVRGIPQKIIDIFSGAGRWLWSAGQDLINGLLDGISSLAGTIGGFFLDLLPGWIVGPFKAALGIASPSKVFKQYGRDTMRGYMLGVEDMKPELDTMMSAAVTVPVTTTTGAALASAQSAPAASSSSKTINYYAAEHQSLSSEEALFAALGSPRAGGDD